MPADSYASEPYAHGFLDVGSGQRVFWEESGNPNGTAALALHGGPGSGFSPAFRRYFDPELYRLIMFDQRGCGRSTPNASDPSVDMRSNTTSQLIADIEALREYLGVQRWVLFGVSWGSTLALAYAIRHRAQTSAIVLSAVTTTRQSEIEWLYGGLRRFFPAEYNRFVSSAGMHSDDDTFDVLAQYDLLLKHPDQVVRLKAARDWHSWEDATVSLEPGIGGHAYTGTRTPEQLLTRARICAHYFSRRAFLSDNEILRNADQLAGMPGTLVHGRFDIGGPIDTAWHLINAWPDATLEMIDAGHMGTSETATAITAALNSYAEI